jgi:hypothetical protein
MHGQSTTNGAGRTDDKRIDPAVERAKMGHSAKSEYSLLAPYSARAMQTTACMTTGLA